VDDQLRRCRGYAESQGYAVVSEHVDTATSGTIAAEDRPEASAALTALDDGRADVLIALKQDRLTRQPDDIYRLLDRSERHGWFVALVVDGLDTRTAYGRAMAGMRAVFGRLETDLASERSRAAQQQRRERGDRLGAPASAETRAAGSDALSLYADGHTWQHVADTLSERGYVRPQGGAWSAQAARRTARSRLIDHDPTLSRDDADGVLSAMRYDDDDALALAREASA